MLPGPKPIQAYSDPRISRAMIGCCPRVLPSGQNSCGRMLAEVEGKEMTCRYQLQSKIDWKSRTTDTYCQSCCKSLVQIHTLFEGWGCWDAISITGTVNDLYSSFKDTEISIGYRTSVSKGSRYSRKSDHIQYSNERGDEVLHLKTIPRVTMAVEWHLLIQRVAYLDRRLSLKGDEVEELTWCLQASALLMVLKRSQADRLDFAKIRSRIHVIRNSHLQNRKSIDYRTPITRQKVPCLPHCDLLMV